jgi:hypothetical protein
MREDQTVASTILQQLGGRRFVVMTGASGFAYGEDQLTFRLPARMTRHRASAMRIVLQPCDAYRLELLKVVRYRVETVDVREGVYVDQLRDVFTDMTGLHTALSSAA